MSGASAAGLGCQADWQHSLRAEVSLIGGHVVKARMRAAAIVEIEVPPDASARVRHAVVGAQIDLLVFHCPPKPLDEHVVPPSSLAVHTNLDVMLVQNIRERFTGEL